MSKEKGLTQTQLAEKCEKLSAIKKLSKSRLAFYKSIKNTKDWYKKYYTDYTSVIVQSFLGRIGLNCCYIPACIAVVFLSQTHQYQRGWLALTILKIKNSLDYF
jgi:hypothetical protein